MFDGIEESGSEDELIAVKGIGGGGGGGFWNVMDRRGKVRDDDEWDGRRRRNLKMKAVVG